MAKPVGLTSEHIPVTRNSSSVPLMSCGADSCTKMVHLVCTSVLNKVEPLPDSKQIPESPLLVVRSLGSRIGGPAFANQTASVEVDRKNSASLKDEDWAQDYDFQPVLETKMRRTVFLIYYLLATVYKTGCPTLLAETNAQFAVGSDGMQGLHYCLTPNPHVFCQPSTLFKAVSHLLSNFVQENTLRLERLVLAAQDEKFTASPSHELVALVEQDLSYVLFNFDMRDLLHLLDMDQHEVKQLKAMMDEFTEVASALRKRHRAAVVFYEASQAKDGLSTDVTVVQDFIVSPITTSDCEKLKELLNQIEVFFTEHITEKHLGVEEGNSLLDKTSLYLNMNGADVLPSSVNYFDGDIIESALRWRQIYQMNRAAAGEDIFELGGAVLGDLKQVLNSSQRYLKDQIEYLDSFEGIESKWKKLEGEMSLVSTELQKAGANVLSKKDSAVEEYRAKLMRFEELLKDLVRTMIEMKKATYDASKSNQKMEVSKGEKSLEEGVAFYEACASTPLAEVNEKLGAFHPSLSHVPTFFKSRLQPYNELFNQIADFQAVCSKPKLGERAKIREGLWDDLIQTSHLEETFSDKFPIAREGFLPAEDKPLKDKINALNKQIEGLSSQVAMAGLKRKIQDESVTARMLDMLEQSTEDASDPLMACDLLLNTCHRLEIKGGDAESSVLLVRTLQRTIAGLLNQAEDGDDGLGIDQFAKHDKIQAGYNANWFFFTTEKTSAGKNIELPNFNEFPQAYRPILRSLSELKGGVIDFPNEVREAVIALKKLEKEEIEAQEALKGEPGKHLSQIRCYISRLECALRLCESLQFLINDRETASFLPKGASCLIKKCTFQSIRSGDFFMKSTAFLFPKKSSVLFDDSNNIVFNEKGLKGSLREGEGPAKGKSVASTNISGLANSFRLFILLWSTDTKDLPRLKHGLVQNKKYWKETLETIQMREPANKNIASSSALRHELDFLQKTVAPAYLQVLEEEFSSPCMDTQLYNTLLSEINNGSLEDKHDREHFRTNIRKMGPDQLLQWILPATLGRKVEFLVSEQSNLSLRNAYQGNRPYPVTFEIFLESCKEKEDNQPTIKLLRSAVDMDETELENVMQKVSQDVSNLAKQITDWSVSYKYQAEVMVQSFHFKTEMAKSS